MEEGERYLILVMEGGEGGAGCASGSMIFLVGGAME